MKIQKNQNNVVYSKELEGRNYSFVFNAKMVQILSDGIYSDKISAIIRELSINATESHKLVGIQTPIRVHIPNSIDPHFSVEDFGVGLTEDEVYNVWCVYGKSTKEDNNDFTGCLGLGSKTPFCYNTRSCVIQSRKNGKEISFLSHLGNDGLPIIKKLGEKPCTETGVKITIPVNSIDIFNFRNKAINIFKYFDILPEIIGTDKTVFKKKEYTYSDDNWGMSDDSHIINIVMGQIAYPIKTNQINVPREITNIGLDIKVNIGDVDIEVSREGLSYNDITKNFLCPLLVKTKDKISAFFFKDIEDSKNSYELRKAINENEYKGFINFPIKWKGIDILTSTIHLSKKYRLVVPQKKTHREIESFIPSDRLVFVENDVKSYFLKRIKKLNSENKNVLIVESEDVDNFKKEVGIDDSYIIKLSSIEIKITKETREKLREVSIYTNPSSFISYSWANRFVKDIDQTKDVYYVLLHRYNFIFNGKEISPMYLDDIRKYCNLTEVYGVRKDFIKKIPSKWLKLEDVFLNKIKNEKLNFSQIVDDYKHKNSDAATIYSFLKFHENDITKQEIKTFIKEFEAVDKNIKSYSKTIANLAYLYKQDVNPRTISVDKIYQKYPLMRYLYAIPIVERKELIFYINKKD